jgi:branched-chain amino acid transport system substrate-binding protein
MAAEQAGSLEPVALRDALAAMDIKTFFGPLKFGPTGQVDTLKPPVFQIQGGVQKVLYPADIKAADFRRVV